MLYEGVTQVQRLAAAPGWALISRYLYVGNDDAIQHM